jgi:hypothetical protein
MVGRLKVLVYLVAGIPLGIAGAAVLLCGWIVVALLAITPLVVPALVGFRAAAGSFAWLEAKLANALLGTDLEPPTLSPATGGFWSRAEGVARDGAFWRQQAYLLQGFVLRGALAICEATILVAGAIAVAVPHLPVEHPGARLVARRLALSVRCSSSPQGSRHSHSVSGSSGRSDRSPAGSPSRSSAATRPPSPARRPAQAGTSA